MPTRRADGPQGQPLARLLGRACSWLCQPVRRPMQTGDIVMPGAFAETLKRGADRYPHAVPARSGRTHRHLGRHRRDGARALRARAARHATCSAAASCMSLIEAGGLDGLSIGFKTRLPRSATAPPERGAPAASIFGKSRS